jgi:ABC-type multidrug transport system fused ATPase/permease subunit
MAHAEATTSTLSDAPRHAIEMVAFSGMVLFVLTMLGAEGDAGLSRHLPLLGLYAFAGVRLFPAAQQVYGAYARLRAGNSLLDHLLAAQTETASAPAASRPPEIAAPSLRGRLEIGCLEVRYPGADRPALRDVSLALEAGRMVALVGPSGCGKSTLVDAILGLLPLESGALRVDGVAIGPCNRRAWTRSIGYAPQQVFLADDTVSANIAFGAAADELDMAAVERAARAAALHDFVTRELPDGYATRVGDKGARLSGGQRQRIGLARALYRDPPLLLLDEATSALDAPTERAILVALRRMAPPRTILIVTHQIDVTRICDEILLLDDGVLAARGDYEALNREEPRFQRLSTSPARD